MTKGLLRSRNRLVKAAPIIRQDIKLDALTLSNLDGATGVAWDTAIIAGLPEGNIVFLAAVLNATITKLTANITATFDGDFSIGTAPTADTTLSGAEVNLIASTAIGAATGGVKVVRGVSTATESMTIHDNTAGTLELNLNLLIDDAAIDADDQSVKFDGVLHIVYIVLGDD